VRYIYLLWRHYYPPKEKKNILFWTFSSKAYSTAGPDKRQAKYTVKVSNFAALQGAKK
jgi:hypothetical protein